MATIRIEERQLGDLRWGVFIQRETSFAPRTLWERYATQQEALEGAKAAARYLKRRGEPVQQTASSSPG